MADPVAPDWNSEPFSQLKQQVMDRFQCTEEDAIVRIQAMWGNATQTLLDGAQPLPPNPQSRPASPQPPLSPQMDNAHLPSKKKAHFPEFDPNSMISDRIPHPPSQFAVGKIEAREYVELWYFTIEGCKEASRTTPTTADDTFGLLNTDTGLALRPIKASKASRNAISDEQLTWEQIMTARHNLIDTLTQAAWPQDYIVSLAELYINLEGFKASGHNPRALILYHAVVRKQWHTALKGQSNIFNVSIINEKLLNKLENQIRDQDQEDLRRQASNFNQNFFEPN